MQDEYLNFNSNIPCSYGGNDIPLGMGTAFSENLSALSRFADMTEERQRYFIKQARDAKSFEEVENIVCRIESGEIS